MFEASRAAESWTAEVASAIGGQRGLGSEIPERRKEFLILSAMQIQYRLSIANLAPNCEELQIPRSGLPSAKSRQNIEYHSKPLYLFL